MNEEHDIERDLDADVARGMLSAHVNEDGEKVYSVTEKGAARVEGMLDLLIGDAVRTLAIHTGLPEQMVAELLASRLRDTLEGEA